MTMNKRAKSNTIRLISGKWRGRRLPVLEHEGLRPTTDRVRETLFNWLMHDIVGARCLDLFAGTGALGLESLSRGASRAVFVETNRQVAAQLQENLQALNAGELGEVCQHNALNFLRQKASEQFDLIFLDPPFNSELLPEAMSLLSNNAYLAKDALIYIEQPSKQDACETPDWQIFREGKAGHSRYTLYQS